MCGEHGTLISFTFKKKMPYLVMSRLDYVLAPVNSALNICTCKILPAFLSDHNAIYLEIVIEDEIKGKGLWKFNMTHLKNPEYVAHVNKVTESAHYKYNNCSPSE